MKKWLVSISIAIGVIIVAAIVLNFMFRTGVIATPSICQYYTKGAERRGCVALTGTLIKDPETEDSFTVEHWHMFTTGDEWGTRGEPRVSLDPPGIYFEEADRVLYVGIFTISATIQPPDIRPRRYIALYSLPNQTARPFQVLDAKPLTDSTFAKDWFLSCETPVRASESSVSVDCRAGEFGSPNKQERTFEFRVAGDQLERIR
ncbi:MAG: hypothetical protein WA021_03515 [Minisyncoccia bacterium]